MISNTNNERHQSNVSNTTGVPQMATNNNAISSGTVTTTTTQVRHVQKPANLVKKSNILKSNVKASLTAEAN